MERQDEVIEPVKRAVQDKKRERPERAKNGQAEKVREPKT
jgi:hypothetical protein